MNLVVGATGLLGAEVCRLLVAEGKTVRALVRPTSERDSVSRLENLGVEIARGDLKHRSTLDTACRGINTVISTASSTRSRQEGDSIETVDLDGQLNLIDAAKAAGVKHFVLISFPRSDVEFPLQTAKRRAEDHLKNSGLTYTILQPTFFMEVWLSPALGFDAAGGEVRVYGSGEKKISWISYRDVAKFAAAAVDNPQVFDDVIKLGGPEALNPLEVVEVFEKIKGQKFDVQYVSEDSLREQKENAVDSLEQSFAGLMLYYSQGEVIDMQSALQRLPVKLTSVRDFAQAGRGG